jgi:ATP-dependent Clp protease ATP-binding subunit ClpA
MHSNSLSTNEEQRSFRHAESLCEEFIESPANFFLPTVGEPGTGKTALAEGLALRIFNRDVPTNLLNNKIFALDVAALHAGASYKGQFEERMKSVLDECENSETGIVLFIDEFHTR